MSFVGDYTVKADTKGRVAIPSAFRKQLDGESQGRFVLRKDVFQNCLVLYPMKEWDHQVELLRLRLNDYNRTHKKFKAQFFRDTAEVEIDASGRILVPKRLLEMVGIVKEIVLAGMDQVVELWCSEIYVENGMDEADFADLAEDILGNLTTENDE